MADLGIQLTAAHSPQAKGRVERLWGTLQDRLVSELRLAGVTTIEQANAFLPAFLARFNRRFTVVAETPGLAYRHPLTASQADAELCFKHERVVAKDNVVRLDGMLFQILPGPLTPLVPPSAPPPASSHPWRRYPSVTKSLNTYRT